MAMESSGDETTQAEVSRLRSTVFFFIPTFRNNRCQLIMSLPLPDNNIILIKNLSGSGVGGRLKMHTIKSHHFNNKLGIMII